VTGTLGVLDIAAERRLIDLPIALTQLQATDFYVSQGLIDALLAQDAARKRSQFPDHI
jgi:predicted nucleic acid-binding protein